VNEDREAAGKKPLAPSTTVKIKDTKVSTTGPESGFVHRDNKLQGFFWLDHRTVDGKHGIITDTHTTPGNVHDAQPYIARLERQLSRLPLNPVAVGLDAGYFTAAICHLTEQLGIIPVLGYRRPNKGHNGAAGASSSLITDDKSSSGRPKRSYEQVENRNGAVERK
jgi:hypothetical protein